MSDDIIRTKFRKRRGVATKGSRYSIAAFLLLLMALPMIGCESPGSVGDGLKDDDESIKTEVLPQQLFEVISANTYSGRLQNSAMGIVDDPAFGNVRSVTLLKPSISRSQVDSIGPDDSIQLRLRFNSAVYGNSSASSSFEIYEAGEIWRGNEIRYNQEVPVNFSSRVGEFVVTDDDEIIEIELSEEWQEKFLSFYNLPSEGRDSTYVREFPGLAIVPADGSESVRFIRHSQVDEDDTVVSSFLVVSPVNEDEDETNGDENGDDEDEEPGVQVLDFRDWGSSMIRQSEPAADDAIVLHNSDRYLKVDLELPKEDLRARNIVNAKLFFSVDQSGMDLVPQIARPEVESIRAHVFRQTPSDLPSEIFISDPRFGTSVNEDEMVFGLDVTGFVLDAIFGDGEPGFLYISIQSVNGIIYSTRFFDHNGPENRKPRLIITTAE